MNAFVVSLARRLSLSRGSAAAIVEADPGYVERLRRHDAAREEYRQASGDPGWDLAYLLTRPYPRFPFPATPLLEEPFPHDNTDQALQRLQGLGVPPRLAYELLDHDPRGARYLLAIGRDAEILGAIAQELDDTVGADAARQFRRINQLPDDGETIQLRRWDAMTAGQLHGLLADLQKGLHATRALERAAGERPEHRPVEQLDALTPDQLRRTWEDANHAERERIMQEASPATLERLRQAGAEPDPRYDDQRATYALPAEHDVFVDPGDGRAPVHPSDVRQGGAGDCSLMASLASIAQQCPDLIRAMIHRNHNDTYTVTFGDGGTETVTPHLPMQAPDTPAGADYGVGDPDAPQVRDIWVAIIEKALAKRRGNDYANLTGEPDDILAELTAARTARHHQPLSGIDLDRLADLHRRGHAILAGTLYRDTTERLGIPFPGSELTPEHVYVVTGVNPADGTVTIRDPRHRDTPDITVTRDQFHSYIEDVYVNPLTDRVRRSARS